MMPTKEMRKLEIGLQKKIQRKFEQEYDFIIQSLKLELKQEREVVDFYANSAWLTTVKEDAGWLARLRQKTRKELPWAAEEPQKKPRKPKPKEVSFLKELSSISE